MDLEQRARAHAALGEPVRLAMVDELVIGDASPGELATRFGLASNLVAFHLRVLDEAGLVRRVRSEGDRRRQYVQLRLDDPAVAALTRPARGAAPRVAPSVPGGRGGPVPARVVFVCTANSARSQLAAAAWRRVSPVPVASAGTHPAPHVHPRAVAAARRHGLDLTAASPVGLDAVPGLVRIPDVTVPAADEPPLLVAVCDNAHEELSRRRNAPARPDAAGGPRAPGGVGRGWLHWHIPDPVRADTDEAFEAAYGEITERVDRLAAALTPDPPAGGDLPAAP